ncbi:hypothetical protein D9M72_472770 [compost metagenome]
MQLLRGLFEGCFEQCRGGLARRDGLKPCTLDYRDESHLRAGREQLHQKAVKLGGAYRDGLQGRRRIAAFLIRLRPVEAQGHLVAVDDGQQDSFADTRSVRGAEEAGAAVGKVFEGPS